MPNLIWKSRDSYEWLNRPVFIWKDPEPEVIILPSGGPGAAYSSLTSRLEFAPLYPDIDYKPFMPDIGYTASNPDINYRVSDPNIDFTPKFD